MIDSHLHLFERGFSGDTAPDAELATYQDLRHRYGITRGLVIGYEGQARFVGNNDYICRLARQHDWIVPLVYLDRTRLAAEPALPQRWLANGAVGWTSYVIGAEEAKAWEALDDSVWEGLDATVPWSLNIDPEAMAVLTARLVSLRHTTVLLSHLGLPGRAIGTPAERLAPIVDAVGALAHPRVKISGLYAVAEPGETAPFAAAKPYLQHLRDRVGVENLVWGSDYTPMLSRQDFSSQVEISAYGVFSDAELATLADDDLARVAGHQP